MIYHYIWCQHAFGLYFQKQQTSGHDIIKHLYAYVRDAIAMNIKFLRLWRCSSNCRYALIAYQHRGAIQPNGMANCVFHVNSHYKQ